ncbi:MAG: hypothetical protein NZ699_12515 [Roseiflexus sp.]|nr:hypothetical protein [Roseiflexus sp.]MCS7289946.1 hypothetical protein [Roseiflexus sp.]MDW8146886.1 hypothetical protein [Roseiflexaceae bacterium]MDW8233365.1 hypothetical protein [Roseiflexaceae bacterium]
MSKKHKQAPASQPDNRLQSLIRSVVTLRRPPAEELARCTRAEKYRRLREHNGQARTRLLHWINEHGLSDEVIQVSEPTVFNTLFVIGTRHAINELSHAPDVLHVAEDSDITTDLPRIDARDAQTSQPVDQSRESEEE